MALIKKNPACLNNLVNSRQPANTGKKQSLLRRKEKVIKHQVRMKSRSAFPKNPKRQPNHQIRK